MNMVEAKNNKTFMINDSEILNIFTKSPFSTVYTVPKTFLVGVWKKRPIITVTIFFREMLFSLRIHLLFSENF